MMNPSKQTGDKQGTEKVQLLTTHEARPASGKPADGARRSEVMQLPE